MRQYQSTGETNPKVSCCELPPKHREEVVAADHQVVAGVLRWVEEAEGGSQLLKIAGSEPSGYRQ